MWGPVGNESPTDPGCARPAPRPFAAQRAPRAAAPVTGAFAPGGHGAEARIWGRRCGISAAQDRPSRRGLCADSPQVPAGELVAPTLSNRLILRGQPTADAATAGRQRLLRLITSTTITARRNPVAPIPRPAGRADPHGPDGGPWPPRVAAAPQRLLVSQPGGALRLRADHGQATQVAGELAPGEAQVARAGAAEPAAGGIGAEAAGGEPRQAAALRLPLQLRVPQPVRAAGRPRCRVGRRFTQRRPARLPPIPCGPKLMRYPFQHDRCARRTPPPSRGADPRTHRLWRYRITSLERQYEYRIHDEPDSAVAVDLVDIDRYTRALAPAPAGPRRIQANWPSDTSRARPQAPMRGRVTPTGTRRCCWRRPSLADASGHSVRRPRRQPSPVWTSSALKRARGRAAPRRHRGDEGRGADADLDDGPRA